MNSSKIGILCGQIWTSPFRFGAHLPASAAAVGHGDSAASMLDRRILFVEQPVGPVIAQLPSRAATVSRSRIASYTSVSQGCAKLGKQFDRLASLGVVEAGH